MANYGRNWAVIEGTETDIARVKSALVELDSSGAFDTFDFENLLPTPKGLIEQPTPNHNGVENTELYGAEDWYDWRIKHWGTQGEGVDGQVLSETPTTLILTFETPDSPPFELYEHLERETGLSIAAVSENLAGFEWMDGIWVYGNASAVFSMKLVVKNNRTGEQVSLPYDPYERDSERIQEAKETLGGGDDDDYGIDFECEPM